MGDKYPRALAVDFRKLEAPALQKYLDHFGISAKPDSSPQDLATTVARHFEKESVDEDLVLNDFLFTHMEKMSSLLKLDKKRKRVDSRSNGGPIMSRKEARLAQQHAAKPDEEVAVRDVGGGWILARVVRYLADRDSYEVRDEDGSKVLILSSSSVRRLEDSVADIQKNDVVLAVFPDTTSFYRAVVSKVKKLSGPQPQEVVVKFEDDEDETGRTPQRYVPARYILRLNQVGLQPQTAHDHDGYSETGPSNKEGGASRKNGSGKYKNMIVHALNKLPHGEGTLGQIYKIVEADFHDELQWKLEGDFKKGPVWKSLVRKSLANPKNGFHMETSGEKAIYSLREAGEE